MTMMEHLLPDSELHAFIDGELEPARAAEIAALLDRAPALAERAARFRADKESIGRFFGPLIDQPLPPALARAVTDESSRARGHGVGYFGAGLAAAAAVILVWLAIPMLTRPSDPLVAEALAARRGTLQAETQFADGAIPPPDRQDQLIGQALGQNLRTPDLGRAGFALAGFRLYATATGKAVELRYRDAAGRIFTVYLHPPSGPDQFALQSRGAMRICIWRNQDLSAVMIGEMSSSEMLRVASLTYADLNF
jgi:anti-sigma factor RsiW